MNWYLLIGAAFALSGFMYMYERRPHVVYDNVELICFSMAVVVFLWPLAILVVIVENMGD